MGRVMVYQARGEELQRLSVDADTLDEATLKTAHGIYTVFRIFPGQMVLRLDRHFQRMRRSGELVDQPYHIDDTWLRQMTRQAVIDAETTGLAESRVRITIPFDAPDTALIALEPFSPPAAAVYEQGVTVGLVDAHRESPRVKSSRFIERRGEMVAAQSHPYYELLLTSDEGSILEGAGSNFYAVLNGVLHTAEEGMLPGIARGMLLEVAQDVLPISYDPIHRADLPRLTEAMLTSSTRGVVPIVQIEDTLIGEGLPGYIFRTLSDRYNHLTAKELEPL